MMETPTISKSAYTSTSTSPLMFANLGSGGAGGWGGGVGKSTGDDTWFLNKDRRDELHAMERAMRVMDIKNITPAKGTESMSQRRVVQVFIADTDENVPLEKSVIYKGDQKLTDATDQELFFEIDIKKILDEHNAYRATLINKKVKERTENLEPVKIRDLKMVVVDIAKF